MRTLVIVKHTPGYQELIGHGRKRGALRQHISSEEWKPENLNSWFEIRDTRDDDDLIGVPFIHPSTVYTL